MAPREGTLWVDRYRPTSIAALEYNKDIGERISRLCASGDIPHLLFYGPSGAGKRTLAACVLRELFGASVEKRRITHRVFKVGEPQRDVEVTTVSSSHHIEVNPAEAGVSDRLVIQEIIKEIASSVSIDVSSMRNKSELKKGGPERKASFKVIILHEVDQMSRLAQQALRRTMEKYTRTSRIIMIAESTNKVLEPLRSRCLGVRVPLPSPEELGRVLRNVGRQEGLVLPDAVVERITEQGDLNTRRAILQLETVRVCEGGPTIPVSAEVTKADWENACTEMAYRMTQRQTVEQLVYIRKSMQSLLSHAVPADVILRRIVREILVVVDDEIAPEICNAAAVFDSRMAKGTNPIFHLEAFAARFMQVYSSFLRACPV